MWCLVVGVVGLKDFVDDFWLTVPSNPLFSGYLFTFKERGNSVLTIVRTHVPKFPDQITVYNTFFTGLLDVTKHFLDVGFGV